MADDSGFQQIYDDIVRKHNLSSPGDLAIPRSLASVMVDSDGTNPVVTARAIASLTDLLPNVPPTGVPTKIEVELIRSRNEPGIDELEKLNAGLQDEIRRLQRQLHDLQKSGAAAGDPIRPMLALPPSNVVASCTATQPGAALPETHVEALKRRRREAGDIVDTGWQRVPFDGGGLSGLFRDGPAVAWQSGDLLTRLK